MFVFGLHRVKLVRVDNGWMAMEDLNPFMTLFTEMSNNTRMAINRGHTPNELRAKSGPPREIRLGPGIAEAVRRGYMNIDELRKGALEMKFPIQI